MERARSGWALASPGYASAHHVVPARNAESWLDHLLRERWHEVPSAAATAAQLARKTDDRTRDVSEAVREEVLRRLEANGADAALIRPVREFVPLVEARARRLVRRGVAGRAAPEALRSFTHVLASAFLALSPSRSVFSDAPAAGTACPRVGECASETRLTRLVAADAMLRISR